MKTLAALLLIVVLSGCSTYRPVNRPIDRVDPGTGYHLTAQTAKHPMGDFALLLAFSGGGTRAAALAYGVLEELRDTPIGQGEQSRRLLDEVDGISSVSGGSFTAAYYGLFGDRIFEDFESKFLYRNVQGQLLRQMLRPKNWFRMATTLFDRTELAILYYDDKVFEGATFRDLSEAGGPPIQINATDLSIGNRFPFIQEQFDFICSDLSELTVSRAVAASSAVPVLFAPLTLRNYAGRCDFEPPHWFEEALGSRETDPRRYYIASNLATYFDSKKRRHLHLVDGGISDNLGIRANLENVQVFGGLRERLRSSGLEPPKTIVIIVVNAATHPDEGFDLVAASPSIGAILKSVSGVQIHRYNFETLELLKSELREWSREAQEARGHEVNTYLVELAFDNLADPEEREFFNNVSTSFVLRDTTIDRLREVSRKLLRESKSFQRFLSEHQGTTEASR